jgi:hypothetical protein
LSHVCRHVDECFMIGLHSLELVDIDIANCHPLFFFTTCTHV